MIPAGQTFVAEMRKACASLEGRPRWERCRELLRALLADPALKRHARSWPVGIDGRRVDNLLFYEDPDYGFVMNALIKPPGGRAMIHDHGPSWTVYGVLEGRERIVHYEARPRGDGTIDLREAGAMDFGPGEVDVVAPRAIHSEQAGDHKTIAVIIRSQRCGTFEQLSYEGARPVVHFGPNQVPFELG